MNKEEFLTTKEYPLRILFYPISLSSERINGIGIGDDLPTQSCVVPIADFYLLKFFAPDIFFFQMKFKQSNPLKKNENNEYDTFVFINGQFENYSNFDSEVFYEYIDEFSGKPNPLKHIITKSTKIKDREKKCIFLAMDFGFPLLDIVDDPQGNGKEYSYQILRKWEEIIDSQHGSLENDFLRTLRRGTRTIIKEYSSLFSELDMISEESHFSASDPLFSFMNVFPKLNPSSRVAPPKILFDRVLVKAIFDLEEERANEYSKILSSEFKKRGYSANIRHSTITKSKVKGKLRMKFTINLGFMEYMDRSSIKSRLNETKYIILSKVKEIDMEAYENFCRSRLEIWLKRIRVHVIIYSNFEEEAIDIIKENFRGVLNYKSLISQKISKNLSKISFRLSFDVVADYSISEMESADSIPDRYTRLAVEELYRGEFLQALRYLETGKNGLLGDLYAIKSKEVDAESVLSREFWEKAIYYYENAKINNPNLSNGYFDSNYKNNVLRALEINSDWIVSLKLFIEARRLEKDTISKENLKEEDLKKKMQWELTFRRYSGLNVDKNLNDFVEEMGSFYSILLENIQRKYGILPHEILGFGF